jgi:hypothetical protein
MDSTCSVAPSRDGEWDVIRDERYSRAAALVNFTIGPGLIADEIDPSTERKAKRAALLETFEGVAQE